MYLLELCLCYTGLKVGIDLVVVIDLVQGIIEIKLNLNNFLKFYSIRIIRINEEQSESSQYRYTGLQLTTFLNFSSSICIARSVLLNNQIFFTHLGPIACTCG